MRNALLTVEDIHKSAATLPASYEREQRAKEREYARVSEYNELQAEDWRKHGGTITTVMPEEIERRVRDSENRLRNAKRTAFETVNRQTFAPDLRAEHEALLAMVRPLTERISAVLDKHGVVSGVASAHFVTLPPSLVTTQELLNLKALQGRLEAALAPPRTEPARAPRLGTAGILARVLNGA